MIPEDSLWPISQSWLYHAARGKFHNLTAYNNAMDHRLGKPNDLHDYLRKAQMLNYEGMRAMFEAFETNRFRATGIIQWMYNSSWPKLWWQLYDYYLMPNGAFYGARKANEPLHIAYDYGHHSVTVMNNTLQSAGPLTASAVLYVFSPDTSQPQKSLFKAYWRQNKQVDYLIGQSTLSLFTLPDSLPEAGTRFLRLQLLDQNQNAISTNTYVLSRQGDQLDETRSTWYITPQSRYADLTALQYLPAVPLKLSVENKSKDGKQYLSVKVKNPSAFPAFMVHLKIQQNGRSVAPVFWSDNYFTVLPGEERTVWVYCQRKDPQEEWPVVRVAGWNVVQ